MLRAVSRTAAAALVLVAGAALTAPGPARAATLDTTEVCAGAETTSFTDVDPAGVFGARVLCIAGYGVVDGLPDGRFLPGEAVTRGQAAKFVANLLAVATGASLETPSPSVFFDVEVRSTFGPFVLQLESLGVVDGVDDGIYAPQAPLSRGEMAAIVHAALVHLGVPLPASDPTFPDVSSGGVFGPQIGALHAAGALEGFADGTFRGGQDITRGQLASYIALAMALADGTAAPVGGGGGGGGGGGDLFAGNDPVEDQAPTVAALGSATMFAGDTLDVTVATTEPDGDVVSLALAPGAPAFAALDDTGDGTGTLRLTPGDGDVGTFAVTVEASDDAQGDGDSATLELTVIDQAAAGTVLYRVDVGGPGAAGRDGRGDWTPDDEANPSPWLASTATTVFDRTGPATLDDTVPDHVPASIYTYNRYNEGDTGVRALPYEFPVPAGQEVTVNLFLADGWSRTNGIGLRVFDIRIDDVLVEDDLDLSVTPGWGIGAMFSYTVVSDGVVDLDLLNTLDPADPSRDRDNPSLRGIELVSVG